MKEAQSLKSKVGEIRPRFLLLLLSEQAFLNGTIKERRRRDTSLPVVFIALTQAPAILLVAAMHSARRRKRQHHCAM